MATVTRSHVTTLSILESIADLPMRIGVVGQGG